MLYSHLRLGLPRGLFSSSCLTKTLSKPLLTPTRASCPAQLILLDFITRTILGEEYRSLRFSLCTFLHWLVPLKPQYSPQQPILKHPQPTFLPQCERPSLCVYSFIHSVFCLTTGPKPPPKRCHHIVRSRASSFK